jgi:hypothetical protein
MAFASEGAYAHHIWWLMHHSYSPKRRTLAFTNYVDDSGSHEESALSVVGGPVFDIKGYGAFTLDWDMVVLRHKVQPPIHMKEFSRKGRFAYLSDDERRALFQDLEYTIRKHKAYSITTEVSGQDFREFFPAERFRHLLGSAPLAFLWVIILNGALVLEHDFLEKMAYLCSHSPIDTQMVEVHSFWGEFESVPTRFSKKCTGALGFDWPSEVNALQAADMVAWSNRKKALGEAFTCGFEPLERLTRTVDTKERDFPHFHYPIPRKSTSGLAEIISNSAPNPKKIGHLEMVKIFKSAFEMAMQQVVDDVHSKK